MAVITTLEQVTATSQLTPANQSITSIEKAGVTSVIREVDGVVVTVDTIVVAIPEVSASATTTVEEVTVQINEGLGIPIIVTPTGGPGPRGPKGDKGDTGAQGVPGPQGIKGDTGSQGPQGVKGDTGATGATGATGSQGPVGNTGAQGPKGDTGAAGATGPQGSKGDQGVKGDQGIPGPQGVKGDTGATGATGAAGSPGPQGDPGPQGIQGIQGIPGAQGETGDPGPQGEPGPQGDKGDTGNVGPAGATGPQGVQGDPGPQGVPGQQGLPGVDGPQGETGPAGADSTVPGPAGPPGADSTVPGPAGPAGAQGPKGDPGAVPEAPLDNWSYARQSAGWNSVPIFKNGVTVQGVPAQQYVGYRAKSTYASATQIGVTYIDFANENDIAGVAVIANLYQAGEADLHFYTTPPGVRTVDRRAVSFVIGALGNITMGQRQTGPQAAPIHLSFGSSYSDTPGAEAKGRLKLHENGISVYSLGVSSGALDYMVPANANHVWWVNGVRKASIDPSGNFAVVGGVQVGGEITMPNPAGALVISGAPAFSGNGGGAIVLRGHASVYQPGQVEFYSGTETTLKYERGAFLATGELALYGQANQILLKNSKSGNERTAIHRTDGANYYVLLSDPATYPNGVWNTLRPFYIELATGKLFSANGQTFTGGLTSDTLNANSLTLAQASYAYLSGDANYVTWSANNGCYIQYSRAEGIWRHGINSAEKFQVHLTGTSTFGNHNANGNITANGSGSAQLRANGDLALHRGNNTGYTFFGSAEAAYVGFDGANYVMPSYNLYVAGEIVWRQNSGPKICSTGSNIVWGSAWTHLECKSTDGQGACIGFHRPGAFGIFLGLDADNVFRLGGWSAGVLWSADSAGNFTAAGNVAAYSDERLKRNWRPVCDDFVTKLAEVKAGIYDRTDTPITQTGCGAQSLQKVLPEAVKVGDHGYLNINYGGAAMLSVIELAKEVVALRAELADLRRRMQP